MSDPYVIVGGGIAGASVAYHLGTRSEDPVTVYDRGSIAGETTRKSGGIFAFYGDETQYRMKRYAMATYNEFLRDPHERHEYVRLGHFEVATTPAGATEVRDRFEGERASRTGRRVDSNYRGSELDELAFCPDLDADRVEETGYMPDVGAFDGRAIAREFAERARRNGVTVETGATVQDVVVEDGAAVGVVVDGERVPARHVVVAAGPWNPRVASMAGVDLPVGHSLAPILVLDPGLNVECPVPYVNHVESGTYCIGRRDGTVLVGHHADGDDESRLSPDDVGDTVPEGRRREMLDRIGELLPPLADAPVVDEWVGVRSETPDGNPIVGWTERRGLSVVAFSSSGIQLSPLAGKMVACQLVDGDPTDYYDALSITRFDGYEDRTG